MDRLKDRVAVITGGAQGLGKATAELFLQEGARVAIWDLAEEAGQAFAAACREKGWDCAFYRLNTADYEAAQKVAEQTVQDFGQIDILVNNAGIVRDASMKKMTSEQWQAVIDVNLTGVFNCTKAVSPYMVERRYGRILNASSVVGLYGNFGQTNYVAAKAGLIGMTKVWAREFGRKGITVNAVAPGFIHTEILQSVPEEVLQKMVDKTLVGRIGQPEDIAQAYLFLASEEASYITGTTLSVDGGLIP